jgi:hypothetical protein
MNKTEIEDVLLGVVIGMGVSYAMLFMFLYWVGAF